MKSFLTKIISFVLVIVVVFPSAYVFVPTPKVHAADTVIFLTTTGSQTWSVPSDWNDSSNSIEIIGAGGGGGSDGRGGGGGGGYAKATNVNLPEGSSVNYLIATGGTAGTSGHGGSAGDTYFCSSTSNCASIGGTAVEVGAKGGAGSSGTPSTGGSGGSATSAVGGVGGGTVNPGAPYAYGGGKGGDSSLSANAGGGGGGAGGPNGAGGTGGNVTQTGGGGGGGGGGGANGTGSTNSSGGAGGNNYLSSGSGSANGGAGSNGGGGGGGNSNVAGGNGGSGTEWDGTHGSGGGGGAGGGGTRNGGNAGGYGGGGGAGGNPGGDGRVGSQGLIVITYTPIVSPTVSTQTATNVGATTARLNGAITDNGGSSITQYGFAYSTSTILSTNVSTSTLGSGSVGEYSNTLTSLAADTVYYYRAYATNSVGATYGSIRSFVAGNTRVTRSMRLFEGYRIKLASGRLVVHQGNTSTYTGYRYIRWNITGNKGDAHLQAEDFQLQYQSSDVTWAITAWVDSNVTSCNSAQGPNNLVDANASTKWCAISTTVGVLTIDAGSGQVFDAYRWRTAEDVEARDPDDWTVEGSNDGVTWKVLDTVANAAVTASRSTWTASYSLDSF